MHFPKKARGILNSFFLGKCNSCTVVRWCGVCSWVKMGCVAWNKGRSFRSGRVNGEDVGCVLWFMTLLQLWVILFDLNVSSHLQTCRQSTCYEIDLPLLVVFQITITSSISFLPLLVVFQIKQLKCINWRFSFLSFYLFTILGTSF